MANLGIMLGGMAQARDQRIGRELQERSLGLQEKQLAFDERTQQRKLVEENLSELTDLAAQYRSTGDPKAMQAVEMFRQRVYDTAAAAGLNPDARVAMFDAAVGAAQTPEEAASGKARGDVAGARAIAEETGADLEQVLQAQGFLPATPEQYRTLTDDEKVALDLPPETVVQISDKTGEIKIVQGERTQKLRSAIDAETGSPVFVTEQDIIDTPGRYLPQPSGMKLVMGENGEFVLATGTQTAGSADLTKKTMGQLEGDEIDIRNMLSRIDNIDASFDPEYLEWGTQIDNWWLAVRDKSGGEILGKWTPEFLGKLTEDEKKQLERYTVFTSRTLNNLNRTLNDLSGAAISPAEAERIRAELPDPEKDSPTEFKAKVDDQKKRLKLEAMKLSYARQKGLDALDIQLSDFEAIVDARGKAIEQEIRLENPDAPDREIRSLVQSALLREFSR